MKITTTYALVWISCSAAVIAGIIVMKSLTPLWALLIPTLVSMKTGEEE